MKTIIREFFRRGMTACGIGPLVLAVCYQIIQRTNNIEVLSVQEVSIGIISLSALAFLAGGMNAIYQIEHLPLMAAISIHGAVLYCGYLATYLVNRWLECGTAPVLVFSGIFVVGYLVIWIVVYSVIKRNTERVNAVLNQKKGEEKER